MWITTITINLTLMRAGCCNFDEAAFVSKRQELIDIDGDGGNLPEWELPTWVESSEPVETRIIPPSDGETDAFTAKRSWNSEQNARSFCSLITDTFGDMATVALEEQV